MIEQCKYIFDFDYPVEESDADERKFFASSEGAGLIELLLNARTEVEKPRVYRVSLAGHRLFNLLFSNFYELACEFYGTLAVSISQATGRCALRLDLDSIDCSKDATQLLNILKSSELTSIVASATGGFAIIVEVPLFVLLDSETESQTKDDELLGTIKTLLAVQQEVAVEWLAERRERAFEEREE